MCALVCVCVRERERVCMCVCQRKTKDRADGIRRKSAHSPRRDSNLYLRDMCPSYFQLHREGRPASRQPKQTLQTLTGQLHRETIMHVRARARVCVCGTIKKGARRMASTTSECDGNEPGNTDVAKPCKLFFPFFACFLIFLKQGTF